MNKIIRSLIIIYAFSVSNSVLAAPIYISTFESLLTLDLDTGVTSSVGRYQGRNPNSFDIAINADGDIYSVSPGGLFSVDTDSANRTFIGNADRRTFNALTFDVFGTLYGVSGSDLFTLDTQNGSTSFIGNIGYTSAGDIVFDSDNNLYLASSEHSLISIDTTTGQGTLIGAFGISNMWGLASVGNQLYGADSIGNFYSIDRRSGASSFVSSLGVRGVTGLASVSIEVPEPSTILISTLVLAFLLKRRSI